MSSLFAAPPGHLTLIMASRRTASFHLPSDPRFSFYLYVPRSHPVTRRARGEDVDYHGRVSGSPVESVVAAASPVTTASLNPPRTTDFPLLVVMHDSSRDAEKLRDHWSALAEEEGCVVLSPHFPCDLRFPDGPDNYKRLVHNSSTGEVRYDTVLFDMIDTVSQEWGSIQTDKFSLVGFSGGGQFVHRFFYLYPERLHAVAIGAPGRATPLVREQWPAGILNAPRAVSYCSEDKGESEAKKRRTDQYGVQPEGGLDDIDIAALARACQDVKVHITIGDNDIWQPVQPDGSRAMSRLDATKALAKSFDDAGIKYDFEIVPGTKHDGDRIREVTQPWIRRHVKRD